ncbi:MAG TPA: molecular chaperone DnaJ [Candidatus Saccharibacteria bacterium]|nr:molecular chaperone DnaJ [Candidatus Saccharibacteria bacterium]
MSKRDYYEVLGVAKGASDDEIKKAFRRKAIELHPDRGGDEEKFKEINEAYEVLKDQQKRQRYDQFGHAGVGGSGGGGNPFEGFNFGGQGHSVNFDFDDLGGFGDLFGSFFGGGGGNRRNKRPERGRDVEMEMVLDFEEAVFGVETEVRLNVHDVCEHCKGTTVEPGHELKTCDTCKGSGQEVRVAQTIFGNIQQAVTCQKCAGKGKIPDVKCSVCNGSGTERRDKNITVKIPAGIDDGATIRLTGFGEATANGNKGDLYVHIRVKPHKEFTREGDLVLSKIHVDMVDAALGTEMDVTTVDGPVRMKVPAGTQTGTDFKLSGHGVPHLRGDARGAHIVTVIVDTPSKLSKEQRELLEQFKANAKKGWFK